MSSQIELNEAIRLYDLNKDSEIVIHSKWIKQHSSFESVNPTAAGFFQTIFHSFEAGIANAISSFKWRKIFLFMKNRHHLQ